MLFRQFRLVLMIDWIIWKLSIDLSLAFSLINSHHQVLSNPNNIINIDQDENKESEEFDTSSCMQFQEGELLGVPSDWSTDDQDDL